jgi:hypothetical protein
VIPHVQGIEDGGETAAQEPGDVSNIPVMTGTQMMEVNQWSSV